MRIIQIVFISMLSISALSAQFGIGITACNDIYQRYSNPEDDIASRSAGGALLNLGIGPKIWVGAKDFSVSVEGMANIGLVSFALKDNKGYGAGAIPILAKLNFGGLSGLNKSGKMGTSIGGGIQYSKTEVYGLDQEFADMGVVRNYIKTYVVQLGYGFGLSGFSAHGFVRYGFNSDEGGNSLNIGIQYDFNLPMLKKIDDPASAL